MPIIDTTYFQTPISIPNTDKPSVANGLSVLINMLEPELLKNLLGTYMYDVFKTNLSTNSPDQRWIDLRDGKTYTYNNKQYKWQGLKEINGNSKTSIIAYYVYYYHLRGKATVTTGLGEEVPKPQAGDSVDSMDKQVFAWNLMVNWGNELYQFLLAKQDEYPEWQRTFWQGLKKINSFNI